MTQRDKVMKIYRINAEGMKLGRLINAIKKLGSAPPLITALNKKAQPSYLVVVENCSKITTSIRKIKKKRYYFHSGCPGGLRTLTWKQMQLSDPEKLVELALNKMLPQTVNSRAFIRKLRLHRTTLTTDHNVSFRSLTNLRSIS